MNEPSVYVIERDAWSTVKGCGAHFRLTYEREFLPVQNLWRDFLVCSEETSLALAPQELCSTIFRSGRSLIGSDLSGNGFRSPIQLEQHKLQTDLAP